MREVVSESRVMDHSKDLAGQIIQWAPHVKSRAVFSSRIMEGPKTKATNPPQCVVIKGSGCGSLGHEIITSKIQKHFLYFI